MADQDSEFEKLAKSAGNIVGEAEVALRQVIGDDTFDQLKDATMRMNLANVAAQEAVVILHKARATMFNAIAFFLTLGALVLVAFAVAVIVG